MNHLVLNYLKDEPKFRERKNKNRGIGNLIERKYHIELGDKKADIISDIVGADRYWRLHTAEHEDLRGNDYDTKKKMSQRSQIEYGYEPLYHQDIKQEKLL